MRPAVMPCSVSTLLGDLADRRVDLARGRRRRAPTCSRSIAFVSPAPSSSARVVAVGARAEDHRRAVEALDEHAALVVGREVHRADHPVAARARAATPRRRRAARAAASGSSSHSKKPNRPQRLSWNSLKLRSTWALMRPTDAAVAPGEEVLGLAVLEERVLVAVEELLALERCSGGTQLRLVTIQPERQLDERASSSRLRRDWPDLARDTAARPYMSAPRIDVFAKARGHERVEQLRAAREADLLPYFRMLESPAAPVVEMEGAERIMLGSNNYLGLTGDERVMQGARDALDALRHRPDRLAPAQRHDRAAPRARARDRRVDGHRGRDRLHDRPPGQRRRRSGRSSGPGDTVDRRLRRPRLDPRRLPALAGQAARRSATTGSTSSSKQLERAAERRRRRARRRRRRLLDGGRHRPAARDRRAVRGATARG